MIFDDEREAPRALHPARARDRLAPPGRRRDGLGAARGQPQAKDKTPAVTHKAPLSFARGRPEVLGRVLACHVSARARGASRGLGRPHALGGKRRPRPPARAPRRAPPRGGTRSPPPGAGRDRAGGHRVRVPPRHDRQPGGQVREERRLRREGREKKMQGSSQQGRAQRSHFLCLPRARDCKLLPSLNSHDDCKTRSVLLGRSGVGCAASPTW